MEIEQHGLVMTVEGEPRARLSSSDKLALAFAGFYMLVSLPWAIASENHEFVFYIGVMALLILLVAFVHLRVGLHPLCMWGFSVWGFLHMAGGLVPISEEAGVLYSYWLVPGRLKYDQLVHAYGFGIATWAVWQGLRARMAVPRPTLGMLFIAACAGAGLGALNEVVEFIAVLTMPETNVGDYANTSWDNVSNFVGAIVAALWIRAAYRSDD